jgi:hypothetical protein
MFNGWKITNILDVQPCELDSVDGPWRKEKIKMQIEQWPIGFWHDKHD